MRKFRTSTFRRGPLPFPYVFLISFFIFILLTLQGIWIVNKSIEPTIMTYAEFQMKRLATNLITRAVQDQVSEGFNVDRLYTVQTDRNGKVSTIDFNTEVVNTILASTTTAVEKYIHEAEEGKLAALGMEADAVMKSEKGTFSVPLGQITKNALLGNLGPRIPVSFTTVGDVRTNIKHHVESYGINNTSLQIVMEVEITLQVIIPFEAKETIVKTDIPIAIKAIQGEVPTYYNGGAGGESPALPVPEEKDR